MEGTNLTDGNLLNNMKKMLIPLIFTNILNSIYSIVDGIWVGNLIGDTGVASITNSYPIITTIVSISTGVSVGVSVIIAQYFGANKLDKVKQISGISYILTGIIGILSTICLILFSDVLLKMIKIPTEILDITKQYITIYLIGYLFYFIFDLITQNLRAIGNTKTPLKLVLIMTTINLILDPILIRIGLGVFGAGLSTAISLILGTLVAIIYVNKKSELLKIKFKNIKIQKADIKDILKTALPVVFQELFIALVYFVELNLINQSGVIGIAGYGVSEKIATIIYIIGTSLQTLMVVAVGQFVGNNEIELTKEVLKNGLKLSIIPVLITIIVVWIFPREACRLFVSSNEAVDAAMKYISVISIILILIPIRGIITGFILGTGHTKFVFFSMTCSGITEFVLLYLLRNSNIHILTRTGIAVASFWSVKMILELIYYFSGKWKKKIICE